MKILPSNVDNTSYRNVSNWSVKLLSTVIVGCMATSAGHTSDLEIYQSPIYGKATILLMLDNSLSMNSNSIQEDNPSIRFTRYYYDEEESVDIYNDEGDEVVDTATYEVTYFKTSRSSPDKYYDRMSRLKRALIPMFANPKSNKGFGVDADINKYRIGLGSFFGNQNGGGGKIDAPARDLTLENRKKLIKKLADLKPETYTPIANAYAEAGAYMLGTNTQAGASRALYKEMGYSVHQDKNKGKGNDKKEYVLYECDDRKPYVITKQGYTHYPCESGKYDEEDKADQKEDLDLDEIGIDRDDVYVTYEEGGKTYYLKLIDNDDDNLFESGFSRSDDSTKNASTYNSPIDDSANQCNGYGIYFLTDGEPNTASNNTIDLMNNSLVNSALNMGDRCNSNFTGTSTYNGWNCTGEYAPLLNDVRNSKNVPIATAAVGFGQLFKEIPNHTTNKDVTGFDGITKSTQVYDCDHRDLSSNAKNLCKLGEKGWGYGEGGFFYTNNSEDIAESVKKFAEDRGSSEISSISTGTMSVPLDSLGGLTSRKFAYLPILEPVPGSQRLWNGNLKKYNVKNGTLVGDDGDFVFEDNTGLFAKNTHDIWNTIGIDRPDTTKPDGGLPQVGGAYQQVFENANAPLVGDRNLFVNTGSSLTNLKVTDQKPVNFASLTDGTENNNDKKLALLKFMGYSVTDTVTDGTALSEPQNKDLKNVGGVLHSIPQLITQSVEVDASGQFDTSTRKDYIIYGSMDGALHMLDDSTGQETFTFVPKQILDLQPNALANNGNGTAVNGSYPYGVDAPWLTYVSYTTKSKIDEEEKTTTNTYEAAQSFALGGLRMGGSMYYALDVTDVDEPKMIYSVGSNYANRQKGLSTDVKGNRNGSIASMDEATLEQKAYARMGQTWGKPTLGYVKSGGERVMVSFLPGGYDDCYEDPQFKLGDNAGADCIKTAAQGNAMYMVQMGKVQIDEDTNEETIKTSTDSGKLLWWASNQDDSANYTARSTLLQYSKDDDLKHSIVTQVRAIDRNYDGLTDHIYFADLGGQVWRADINNNKDTVNFKVDRVVKVLDVSDQASDGDAPPRIYERPLITFYNGKYDYEDAAGNKGTYSGVQTMITVGTGDRSSPVSAERNTPDALYTVIDKDMGRRDLFDYSSDAASTISLRTPVIKVDGSDDDDDVTGNNLKQLTFTDTDRGDTGIRQNMTDNVIQGWYMPFTYWDDSEVSDTGPYKLKMFNEPDAIAGILISSTYNPDAGQDIQACSAGVKGSTQRERTCLPYGSCSEDADTPRSVFVAGSGIVDNIVSQYNDTSVFSSLVNRCEGEDCEPDLICPNGDCNDNKDEDGNNIFNECVGLSCGVDGGINTDKRINPLSWMEH
ncbi:hypothetical protein [Psychrobacter pacificensis]|uniref:hypothetical protein n=1 Tax=Psychrobacter pacificensis TaxID=112002 RepID=UPI003CFF9A4C